MSSESDHGNKMCMADAYFDILAHDVTNLISPIMVHAEFIALGKELPDDARSSAAKILRQIRRTANFILSFRMLHEVASSPPTEPVPFDVRELAKMIQETSSTEYPSRTLLISVDRSPEAPVMVTGSEYLGRIVLGLIDNAVRNASRPEVRVWISFQKVEHGDGTMMWRCEVADDGPGISDDAKGRLMLPFEASTGLIRGSPSSLMFYSEILRHLGGVLLVENRMAGGMGKGTRAVVEVPCTRRDRHPTPSPFADTHSPHDS